MTDRRLKVVLAPYGTRGDVQPLVVLGRGLMERGHHVSLVAPENFARWVRGLGLEFESGGPDIEKRLQELGDRSHGFQHQLNLLIREMIPLQFELLPRACKGADIVVGAGLQLAGSSVAEAMGIPYLFVAYAPVALPSAWHPPPFVKAQGLPRWLNRSLWLAFRLMARALLGGPVNRGRRRLGLEPLRDLMTHYAEQPTLLAAEPHLALPPPDLPPTVRKTGPLMLEARGSLEPDLERFLEAGDPPVLVGFGSMVTDRWRELVDLFQRAAELAGCRIVFQTGWTGIDPQELHLGRHCWAVESVPHQILFPKLCAVVHHGGAGTTTSVARAGLPQLVTPHLLDQYFWGGRVFRLGLGPKPLEVSRVRKVEPLAERLADLVGAKHYRASAAALAAKAAQQPDSMQEAVTVVESIAGRNGSSSGSELAHSGDSVRPL